MVSFRIDPRYFSAVQKYYSKKKNSPLKIFLDDWIPLRPLGMNKILHSICRQIAKEHYKLEISTGAMSKDKGVDLIKEGIKGASIPYGYPENKPSHLADVKEFSILLETGFAEAYAAEIDIRENLLHWQTVVEKKCHGVDPVLTYYKDPEELRERRPYCEACLVEPGCDLAHIVGKDLGGPFEAWNLMHLCARCHRAVQHDQGFGKLIELNPIIEPRISYALDRFRNA